MFHGLEGLTRQEQMAQNTRRLVGEGTPYLKAPGLKRVTAVRMDGIELPLEVAVEYPLDNSLSRLGTMRLPLVAQMPDENGTPILLRSILSNDGIWQKDAAVYVTGEWDEEAAEVSEPVSHAPATAGRRRG